jgi:hypothetical protein
VSDANISTCPVKVNGANTLKPFGCASTSSTDGSATLPAANSKLARPGRSTPPIMKWRRSPTYVMERLTTSPEKPEMIGGMLTPSCSAPIVPDVVSIRKSVTAAPT